MELPDKIIFQANTYEQLVTQLRMHMYTPDIDNEAYMKGVERRIGRRLIPEGKPYEAEVFLKAAQSAGMVRRILAII